MIVAFIVRADALIIEFVPRLGDDVVGDLAGSVSVRKTLAAAGAAPASLVLALLFAGCSDCIMLFKIIKGVKITIKSERYFVVNVLPANVLHFELKGIR